MPDRSLCVDYPPLLPDGRNLSNTTSHSIIDDSEVVKLDGKPIHISFLENQIAALAEEFELTADVRVDSGAVAGPVLDVTKAINEYTTRYITHKRAV